MLFPCVPPAVLVCGVDSLVPYNIPTYYQSTMSDDKEMIHVKELKELHSVDTLCVWTQALCIHSHSSVLLPSSFRCYSQSHQTTECLLRFFQWSVLQVRVRPPSRRLCSFTRTFHRRPYPLSSPTLPTADRRDIRQWCPSLCRMADETQHGSRSP